MSRSPGATSAAAPARAATLPADRRRRQAGRTAVTWAVAAVWWINGLACKWLGLVPRHREIAARILGEEHAAALTRAIGVGEVMIGLWVISRLAPRLAALVQVALVVTMNALEQWLVPDLLLWGRWNALFAFLFCLLVLHHGFRRPAGAGEGDTAGGT